MKLIVLAMLCTTAVACSGEAFEGAADAGTEPGTEPEHSLGETSTGVGSEGTSTEDGPEDSPTVATLPGSSAQPTESPEPTGQPADSGSLPGVSEPPAGAPSESDAGAGSGGAPGALPSAPGSAEADAGPIAAEVVNCTLGDEDRGAQRVMHEECPAEAPFCQRHGYCGNDEWEAPECSRTGYDFEDVNGFHCKGYCNKWLVCVND